MIDKKELWETIERFTSCIECGEMKFDGCLESCKQEAWMVSYEELEELFSHKINKESVE